MSAQKLIVSSNPDPGVAEGQDDGLLASLGYKQGLPTSLSLVPSTHDRQHTEFKRNFTPLEVFGMGFTVMGLVPSIAYVLYCMNPTAGKLTK